MLKVNDDGGTTGKKCTRMIYHVLSQLLVSFIDLFSYMLLKF